MGVIRSGPLATGGLLGVCVRAGPATPPQADGEAERCTALIETLDEIVLTRFDHRLLALEHFELAEADCAAGRYRFGLQAIAEGLRTIGVRPPVGSAEPPS